MMISRGASLILGKNVYVGSFVNIRCNKKIEIGSNSLIAQYVSIIGGQYNFKDKQQLIGEQGFKADSIIIGDNVWIGTGAIILPGVNIGIGAVIGAGAVVAKDIPSYAIAVGTPARVIGYRE